MYALRLNACGMKEREWVGKREVMVQERERHSRRVGLRSSLPLVAHAAVNRTTPRGNAGSSLLGSPWIKLSICIDHTVSFTTCVSHFLSLPKQASTSEGMKRAGLELHVKRSLARDDKKAALIFWFG